MKRFAPSHRFCLFAGLAGLALAGGACAPQQITHRSMLGVTSGGVGESWIVVEETSGRTDREFVDENRYVVYRCVSSGCVAVSVLRGSERRELPRGAAAPSPLPSPVGQP